MIFFIFLGMLFCLINNYFLNKTVILFMKKKISSGKMLLYSFFRIFTISIAFFIISSHNMKKIIFLFGGFFVGKLLIFLYLTFFKKQIKK